jgi:hypothetical protein
MLPCGAAALCTLLWACTVKGDPGDVNINGVYFLYSFYIRNMRKKNKMEPHKNVQMKTQVFIGTKSKS